MTGSVHGLAVHPLLDRDPGVDPDDVFGIMEELDHDRGAVDGSELEHATDEEGDAERAEDAERPKDPDRPAGRRHVDRDTERRGSREHDRHRDELDRTRAERGDEALAREDVPQRVEQRRRRHDDTIRANR